MPSSLWTAKQVASYRGVIQLGGARYVLAKYTININRNMIKYNRVDLYLGVHDIL